MSQPQFLTTKTGRTIAYHQTAGQGPGVVFLGGFESDMTGTKAMFLENRACAEGRAFVRFDYSGHGASQGRFQDGCIGDWAADARDVLQTLTTGPQILVGSSMGGWISLLLARSMPTRIAGLVGVAAAPDFTEDSYWVGFDEDQQNQLMIDGFIALKSEYSDNPTIITRKLIEDGRQHLVLRAPLHLPFPSRFLQGTADVDVPPSVALRVLSHAHGPDIRLTLVKDADHRFSTPDCLSLIADAVADLAGTARR
jgi:pimeloyl-ACP methyl ester carboxylesterase